MLERYLAHSLPDPAQNTLWYLICPFTNNQIYHVLAERISATFPKNAFRPRHSEGSFDYFPETSDIDGINISFYETFDFRVTAWLDKWRKLIKDPEGNYNPPILFKREFELQLFSRDNMTSPTMTILYQGVAPSDQTPIELAYEDETGRIMVEAQFSVDNQVIKQGTG